MQTPSCDTTATDRHAKRPRLLLVDDKPNNLRMLRAMLGSEDYDIISVDSGQAALDLLGANPSFDLVLLDVAMPDLNGIEVCSRLKRDRHTRHIPVLLVSALNANDEFVKQGLKAGAEGYLVKPLEGPALLARVRAALRLNRLERETPENGSAVPAESDEEALRKVARLSRRLHDPLQTLCATADLLALEVPADSRGRALVDQLAAQVDRVTRLVSAASRTARERLESK